MAAKSGLITSTEAVELQDDSNFVAKKEDDLNVNQELKDVVEEEEIDFIESHFKGFIIGKQSKGLIGLGETTGTSLYIRGDAIWVLGTQCQRDKVKAIIHNKINTAKHVSKREVFAWSEDWKYLLRKVDQTSNRNIYVLYPKESKKWFNLNYDNMSEFKEHILKQLESLKKRATDKNASGQIYLHIGRLTVAVKEDVHENDVFTVKDIQDNCKGPTDKWNLRFESAIGKLSPKLLDGLDVLQSYIRYDYAVTSPTSREYRYKVYMREERDGSRRILYDLEDLRIPMQKGAKRIGPGLLWGTVYRTCRADILLPKEFAARFNIDLVYPYDQPQDPIEESERKIIAESFCERLTESSILHSNLPKLPNRYDIRYFRQSVRTEYEFRSEILVKSEEKEFVAQLGRVEQQNNMVDIFLDFNFPLDTSSWSIEDVTKRLSDYFSSFGHICDYYLRN